MATSYNGWPASDDKSAIGVEQFGDAQGFPFPGGVKSGDVYVVLGYVATQLHNRVEPCIGGWCWGYTYKANVNNPSQLSCHASATAIDWNSPDHSNGTPASASFTDAQIGTIYQILTEVEGAVSWLADYDPMHFEICVSAKDLAPIAARLRGGATPPPAETGDDDMPLNDDDRKWISDTIRGQLNQYFANGEGNPNTGRIVQACNTAINNKVPAITDAVWNEVMPSNADGGTPEKSEPGRKARDTMGTLMTMVSRIYR
jgi:hypothetical protein